MKEIFVLNRIDDLTQATEILRNYDARSITFEINDYDRDKLGETQEIVEAFSTRRSILTKDESILPDWKFIDCQTKLEVFAN
jgi:hypothetical protein